MKHLLIVGAGGFGREMFAAAREAIGHGTEFDVKGFLDDRAEALDGFRGYPPIVGSIQDYVPAADDVFITALGSVAARWHCVETLAARGARFIAIVHRSASLGPNVTVGEGSFIAHNVVLTADVTVGNHVCVFHGTSIGHDTVLGDFSHVYAQCAVGGAVKLGEGAVVYPGATIVPRRALGKNAVVGAGAVAFLNVPDNVTVVGNPAHPL